MSSKSSRLEQRARMLKSVTGACPRQPSHAPGQPWRMYRGSWRCCSDRRPCAVSARATSHPRVSRSSMLSPQLQGKPEPTRTITLSVSRSVAPSPKFVLCVHTSKSVTPKFVRFVQTSRSATPEFVRFVQTSRSATPEFVRFVHTSRSATPEFVRFVQASRSAMRGFSYGDCSLDTLRLTQFVLTSNSLARGNETPLLQTPEA